MRGYYILFICLTNFAWIGLYNNSVSSKVCLDRYNVEIDATKTTKASYIILVFLFKLNPKIWNIYSIKELEKIESNKQINKQNYFRNRIYIYNSLLSKNTKYKNKIQLGCMVYHKFYVTATRHVVCHTSEFLELYFYYCTLFVC